ncbi:MAG: TIGR03084 family metal-binding protein [Hyphomicrobiaceae bacterium]
MLEQISDFEAEVGELASVLATIPEIDWEQETDFKRWTINDVVQHLHLADLMGLHAATDVAGYHSMRAALAADRRAGLSMRDHARRLLGRLSGFALLETWREATDELCSALAAKPANARIPWAGPDMGVRMFATARQMETWAHGQEIYDLRRLKRSATDRLRNIAEIGVRTYPWTFANRGRDLPGEAPHVRLIAPSGAEWRWNDRNDNNYVTGCAEAFCQVVTQVRNIADTDLSVKGTPAEQWMAMALCFAGPPEDPPLPGARTPPI